MHVGGRANTRIRKSGGTKLYCQNSWQAPASINNKKKNQPTTTITTTTLLTLHRALRRMAGLVFLLVFWVLAGACQRHGVGGFYCAIPLLLLPSPRPFTCGSSHVSHLTPSSWWRREGREGRDGDRAPSTVRPRVRPLARDPRILVGWPFPLGFGLDGRFLLARRARVYV